LELPPQLLACFCFYSASADSPSDRRPPLLPYRCRAIKLHFPTEMCF
jgi:hypothetical protein